jgi:hypothetical protein
MTNLVKILNVTLRDPRFDEVSETLKLSSSRVVLLRVEFDLDGVALTKLLLEVRDLAQALEPAVDHDADALAESFALFHAKV